ncbi:hypothetical protein W97_06610 [Coniosporium apollinis CBS 100218]|uniref:PRISE-like Rossmann-fold domain-containing protein n=1 Tax=Coniosporium apollinis (strain CBS 100218) TaxID=1168221 RepID=R7YZM0_CONA1|nr:uncharacterized protein W97_06610 [Coniosporium apollinis CBS 100218]EON67357.1 hypothetical protein W97_06610 [Coniosporium apollinis CBS 100218]
MPRKSALIFGASGVSGWSFVNEILHDYPKEGTWDKVHALTNRPLKKEDSHWPDDTRLNIVSGIDLLKGSQEELEDEIRSKADGVEKVTHVYYLAYKANTDIQKELTDAVNMFKRSTIAMDHLSPALEFVVLQTGAKMYGCHLLENHPQDPNGIHVPLEESMPRLTGTWGDLLFYHPQLDWLKQYAEDKAWSWCETRPDIIIGFVPNQNFYSLGTVLGIYLSLFRAVEGGGAECPFPGTEKSWVAKSNDSSSDMIARQTIHLSLTLPKDMKGEGFNVADAKNPESWSTKWPQLCRYFGLKGTGPNEAEEREVRKYIQEHLDTWKELEARYGLKKGIANSDLTFKGFEFFLLIQFDFDREYDMTKMYDTGFKEERTVMQAWGGVFDRMVDAGIIPPNVLN